MLRALDIRDLLIVERLELAFGPGLNVLTGETGAGKSIMLDALGFVLGWRGRAVPVRAGARVGEVVASFALPPDHPARAVLVEAGLPDDEELLIRRSITAEGRRSAWVNDRRAGAETLRALGDCLLELHGQHDDRGLLDAAGHRALLDLFGGHGPALGAVRAAWAQRSAAAEALEAARARRDALAAEEEFLRHAVAEIGALAPEPGEEEALDATRRKLQAAREIGESIARAHHALGRDGAEGAMGDALRWLEGAGGAAEGRLDGAIAALERALGELGEAAQAVETCLEDMAFDEAALERATERLFDLRALARKHRVAPDALAALGEELAGRLAALEAGEGDIAARRTALAEAEAAFGAAADDLGARRRAAAATLDAAMAGELAPLKLERAVFATQIMPAEPGPEGTEKVQFTVATNPGAPPGPLHRIASGGELSRFLLALKVCLRGSDAGRALIFDEIDRGVGGATADAVGRRLAALAAEGGQVLVVTHSPQVAAAGAVHFRVAKRVVGGETRTEVARLDPPARVDEIARMLSGETVTEAARAAARALIEAG